MLTVLGELLYVSLPSDDAVPGDTVVVARTPAVVELAPGIAQPALFVETPTSPIQVRWDGSVVLESHARRSLLVRLQTAEPGPHELDLTILPGFDGSPGRAYVGEYGGLLERHLRAQARWSGFAVALAVLALVHLAIAWVGHRRAHLNFGLWCATLGVWTFGALEVSAGVVEPFLSPYRLDRVVEALVPPLTLGFLTTYATRSLPRWVRQWAYLAVALAIASLLLPYGLLQPLEYVEDVLLVAAATLSTAFLATGIRARVRGSALLLAGVFPLAAGAVHDVLVSSGAVSGPSYLYPTLPMFVAAASAALTLNHADLADRHRRLVAGSVDALIAADPRGDVLMHNVAATRLLGARVHNVLGAVHESDREHVVAHLARALEHVDSIEFRVVRDGHEFLVESIATPLPPGLALLTLRDVTQRRVLEHGLLQAARMETLGVVVGGVAHDVNNMLSTLLAHVTMMRKAPAPTGERLDKMESAIARAGLLTRRLLTIGGGRHADLAPAAIGSILRSAAELAEPALAHGPKLELDAPEHLGAVLASSSDLEQVIFNLILNARDAAGREGTVRIAARSFELSPDNHGVVVMVEDHGPGVPHENQPHIFDPFFTTKAHGTGLGLAIAAQVARAHRGRIWYEDTPGGGARLLLALRAPRSASDVAPPVVGVRIVVVDDEPELRESYATELRAAGCEVTVCANGAEAWSAVEASRPDVLVTDVVMPGMSGLDLAARCARDYPDVPVLLISGYIPQAELSSVGGTRWCRLEKPVQGHRLVDTVGRLYQRAELARRGEIPPETMATIDPPLDGLTAAKLGF